MLPTITMKNKNKTGICSHCPTLTLSAGYRSPREQNFCYSSTKLNMQE